MAAWSQWLAAGNYAKTAPKDFVQRARLLRIFLQGVGVIDSAGRPKPAWYALKRAFAPLHLALTDEGGAGLGVQIVNEGRSDLYLELELTCVRDIGPPPVSVRTPLAVPARSAQQRSAFALIGGFYDLNHAYGFGPLGHRAVVARLRDRQSETVLAEAFHFPGAGADFGPAAEISAVLDPGEGGWRLLLTTDRLARFVSLTAPGYRPSDNGFDMAPGAQKVVSLHPLSPGAPATPHGQVRALGGAPRPFRTA